MNIQFSDKISEDSPELRLLSLAALHKKVCHELFVIWLYYLTIINEFLKETYMNKSIKCYSTRKIVDESNDLYTKKVSNCFSEVRKFQKSSIKDLIESMQTLKNFEVKILIILYL